MGLESESGEITIPVEESTGEIKIANDVVATIAALAATETKGVAYLSGSLTHDVIAKHSSKNLSKGVMVTVEGKNVSVQISLIIEYGCSVPVVTAKVQERVLSPAYQAVSPRSESNSIYLPHYKIHTDRASPAFHITLSSA